MKGKGEQMWKLNQICLIIPQKQIYKIQQLLINQILLKTDFPHLKSAVGKLDIDKLKNLPTNLNNLKSKVDKFDVCKLVPVPVELSKLSVE